MQGARLKEENTALSITIPAGANSACDKKGEGTKANLTPS
jgi:hypothetical protein